jgi:hypothetical protein
MPSFVRSDVRANLVHQTKETLSFMQVWPYHATSTRLGQRGVADTRSCLPEPNPNALGLCRVSSTASSEWFFNAPINRDRCRERARSRMPCFSS